MAASLDVRGLTVELPTPSGWVRPVNDVSFTLARGETLGIVGESGSGKTMLSLALMGLEPHGGRRQGEAWLHPRNAGTNGDSPREDLLALSPEKMREVRGREIAMIFQEPMTALNPVLRIGAQIEEAIRVHEPHAATNDIRRRALAAIERAALSDPGRRARQYPHQLSGGLRQRVMIAMALAAGPGVLIADEPTTALDVTVQKQILELLAKLRADLQLSMLFITHDLGVVAQVADRVAVMYAGRIVEEGPVAEVLHAPSHPYTQALLRAAPRLAREKVSPDSWHRSPARCAARRLRFCAALPASRTRMRHSRSGFPRGKHKPSREVYSRPMSSANSPTQPEKVSDQQLKALVRDRFTKTAEVFGDYAVTERVAEAELLARLVNAGSEDLAADLACGPGTLALRFAKHVRWICALDFTPAILARARHKASQEGLLEKFGFALGDAQALPFADTSLDLSVTSYSLHHISDPACVIREMSRVVKRGGRVGVIDIIAPEDPKIRALNHRIEYIRDSSHSRSLTQPEFAAMFSAAGLRIIATEYREHPRVFAHWMHVAGWKPSDPEFIEARRLMVDSIAGDSSNFHPRFQPPDVTQPGAEPDLYMVNTSINIAAEKL